MIQLSNHDEREAFLKAQKNRILSVYKNAPSNPKTAVALTKAEFDEQFPADKFEAYSLDSVHKFRQEILKAEDIEDKDGAFKDATSDLRALVVHGEGKQAIMFVREKVKGE